MYTSYIGKKFLELYNNREEADYSAEVFFDNVIYPLFFNDNRHFLNVANSSFFQSVSKKLIEGDKSIHKIKLERFHKNILEDGASLTTMVGYAAQDIKAGTSGQLSNLPLIVAKDDMYSSWIGSGFSVAMGAGYSILIDDEESLILIFLGWKYYRRILDQTPNLKGNQIDVWNSHWISHVFSKHFDIKNPIKGFQTPDISLNKESGKMVMSSLNWSNVIFILVKKYPSKMLTANVFKFGKMNITIGFINIYLPDVRKLFELRDKLFISEESTVLNEEEIENLSTFYSFKDACKLGTIGLRAMEPAQLRVYMPSGSVLYARGKEFKFTDKESYKQYQLFKIWIIAMINKTELLELASSLAQSLIDFEEEEERGKKVFSTLSKEVRESKNLKHFIDKLSIILPYAPSKGLVFESTVEAVLKMPSDNFPLFITLIRFEYALKKSNQ